MGNSDLESLLADCSNEDLNVEYKAWLDTGNTEAKAKVARHLAALANHGGGYLVFGVDDKARKPLEASPYPLRSFGDDEIARIVKRYLQPSFQCHTRFVEHAGVEYPVVIVPSHGSNPVVACADGPQDTKGRVLGINAGAIYIRAPGPESIAVRKPEDWTALIERCISHRADLLATIMRRAIVAPARPTIGADEYLKAASEATVEDFQAQTQEEIQIAIGRLEKDVIRSAKDNFSSIAYVVLDGDGAPIPLDSPSDLNARANVGLHQYANSGWTFFCPLTSPGREPQRRLGDILGKEQGYLEGMRIPAMNGFWSTVEYWRIYDGGAFCIAESFPEDYSRARGEFPDVAITAVECLTRFHSILAHARFVGQELPAVGQILLRLDFRGMTGRFLGRSLGEPGYYVSAKKLRDDRVLAVVRIPWEELRSDYFSAFGRVCAAFFEAFADSSFNPKQWPPREVVEQWFRLFGQNMKLIDD